jgi:hypothetical protein
MQNDPMLYLGRVMEPATAIHFQKCLQVVEKDFEARDGYMRVWN